MAAESKREKKAREAAEALEKARAQKETASRLVKNGEVMSEKQIEQQEETQQQEQQQQETSDAADQKAEDQTADSDDDEAGEDDDEDQDDDVLPPGVTPKATFAAEVVYGVARDLLMAAVEAGDLIAAGWKAKRAGSVKPKDGKAKAVYALYEALKATNETGAILLCGGRNYLRETLPETPKGVKKPAKGVWDMFYYGHDLEVGRSIRSKLLKAAEGPEKAIREMAEMMVLHKMAPDFETAKQMVIASRQAAGMEV